MNRPARSLSAAVLVPILLAGLLFAGGTPAAQAATLPQTVRFTQVATGLTQPVFVTGAGDGSGRLFVVERAGKIRIIKNGSLLSTPFLDIVPILLFQNFTAAHEEQGLLGLAFDPNYSSNGLFYVTYTRTRTDTTFKYAVSLARFHVSTNADVADPASGEILLSAPKKYDNHNGGMIAFGPDGYLYWSVGDGGSQGDPDDNGQSKYTLLGKMLRLDVTTAPPIGERYVIPASNPFYGSADVNVRQEIWSLGLRNTWRFSFDDSTGDMYMADVGQYRQEEVDYQPSTSTGGENYGWNILEGSLCYDPDTNCVPPTNYVAPVAKYDHGTSNSYGCSITGGYVYRGLLSPSLDGVYFYGDYCTGKVFGLVHNLDNSWTSQLILSTTYDISSFGQDDAGELYVVDYAAGTIYQLSAAPRISGNVRLPGVNLSWTDGTNKVKTSDSNGDYTFVVSNGWDGTVTPSRTGCTFVPPNRTYTDVVLDQTAQDYLPTCSFGYRSGATPDGWVRESTETSDTGGKLNYISTALKVGDSNYNQQFISILSFNTSALPDTATITAAKLELKKAGATTVDPFGVLGNILVDIKKPAFGTSTKLQLGDFNALADAYGVASIAGPPVSNWFSADLTDLTFINKTGVTQFRLRFATDDNNDSIANFIKFYSGDGTSSLRPKLTITFNVP